MAMWEAAEKSAWQNFRHEVASIARRAQQDWRFLGRDFSRKCLGSYRSRDAFAWVLAQCRPRTPGFTPSEAVLALRRELLGPGYTAPLPLVSPEQAAEIRDYFMDLPYTDPYRAHLGEFRYPDTPCPESNQGYYAPEAILRAPHVMPLLNHPLVLETAEAILGCKPLLENVTCWWAFAGRSVAKGVQRYHRDFDTPRFIKLFLYLTDVDSESGAHVFVRGSQRSKLLNLTRYIADAEVEAGFGRDAITTISGPAGTCFLEDTYGVHRAGLPGERPRLVISAQYNIWPSPFAPAKPPLRGLDRRYDPWINRAYFA